MIIKLSPAHFNMFYFVFFMFGWKINASDEFVNCKIDCWIRPAPLNGDVQSQPGTTGPSVTFLKVEHFSTSIYS